jgi:hypothetical protein
MIPTGVFALISPSTPKFEITEGVEQVACPQVVPGAAIINENATEATRVQRLIKR